MPATSRAQHGPVIIVAVVLLSLCAWPLAFGWGHRETPADAPAHHVNINTADSATLQLLPGVGPALAEKIIAARRDQPFTSAADLQRVSGIAQILADRIAPHVICE